MVLQFTPSLVFQLEITTLPLQPPSLPWEDKGKGIGRFSPCPGKVVSSFSVPSAYTVRMNPPKDLGPIHCVV